MKVCDGNIFPDNDNFKKVVKMIYADIKADIKQQDIVELVAVSYHAL